MNAKTQRFWIGSGLFALLLGIALRPLFESTAAEAVDRQTPAEASAERASPPDLAEPAPDEVAADAPKVEALKGESVEGDLETQDSHGASTPTGVDAFHPERETPSTPRTGGRVTLRLASMPASLNLYLQNTAAGHWILNEVHEFLVQRDWETLEFESVLAERFSIEDTVVLRDGSRLIGTLETSGEEEPLELRTADGVRTVARADVEDVLRGTVFTFRLRDDVRWQDGHPFGIDDIAFSFACTRNPSVECDRVRYKFDRLKLEVVDPRTVRFHYAEQYMLALEVFEDFCILPSHIFDLRDPDHPEHDPDATDEAVGLHVNGHPANRMWVGLGPYRITRWDAEGVVAERQEDYDVSPHAGFVDTIHWRHISDDGAAAQAMLNGDLDFNARMRSADYFGAYSESATFKDHCYKGFIYTGYMNYVAWNLTRPQFQDPRVRRALAHAFDWDELLDAVYYGMGRRVTSTVYRDGPNYDESVVPLAYDLERAEELLSLAGWVDRDGDGLLDRDGEPFRFEYLYAAGQSASEKISQLYQDKLGKLGIEVTLTGLEWGAFLERVYAREFDAMDLAWSLPVLSDPTNMWHSSTAEGYRTNNRGGFQDEACDALIEAIQVELDPERRAELFHRLHRRIYELQPYNFGTNVPAKFAMSRAIRGFQIFQLPPGYSVRRWYREE